MTQTMDLATKLNQNLVKLEVKYDKELNEQIDSIVKKNMNDINKTEAEVKKKYDENQLNIKKLEQIREAFKKAVKEIRKLENA
jgi:TRAP-type C4-dicarboxylate transport system substrate-binding protein